MALQEDFNQIIDYAHFWNWAPDWGEVQRIYEKFPDSFSVLTPFAYSYLEELVAHYDRIKEVHSRRL